MTTRPGTPGLLRATTRPGAREVSGAVRWTRAVLRTWRRNHAVRCGLLRCALLDPRFASDVGLTQGDHLDGGAHAVLDLCSGSRSIRRAFMKLYSAPLSLFSRKVEIALREKAISFEREMVPFTQAHGYEPRHPVVLAVNPKRQVPVLIEGDLALFDSTLIFEYLEDLRPSPPLYPTDMRMRARCRLVELIGDEVLAPLAIQLGYRTEPPDDDAQVQMKREAAGRQTEADIAELYNDLTRRLGPADFFCGDFSYADIALFMAVLWVLRLSGPRLDAWPGLARWYARVGARHSVAVAAAEIAAADRELSPPIGHE